MSDDLTKLTVNLTPKAAAALGAASLITELSRTDCTNRALQLYAKVEAIARQHTTTYRIELPDWDEQGPLYVVVTRERDPEKR